MLKFNNPNNNPKKLEFMKIVVYLTFLLSLMSIVLSYVLAFCGLDSNAEVTSEIVRTLLVTIVAYALKSFGEKNSRNKYSIDENGNPLPRQEETPCGEDEIVDVADDEDYPDAEYVDVLSEESAESLVDRLLEGLDP